MSQLGTLEKTFAAPRTLNRDKKLQLFFNLDNSNKTVKTKTRRSSLTYEKGICPRYVEAEYLTSALLLETYLGLKKNMEVR